MILDPKLEIQIARCRLALQEIDVPDAVINTLSEMPPMLMQVAHMTVMLEVHWRDALRWVYEHRGEIYAYARGEIDVQGKPTTTRTNRAFDGIDVGSTREGQPIRMGDDGLPMGRAQNPIGEY